MFFSLPHNLPPFHLAQLPSTRRYAVVAVAAVSICCSNSLNGDIQSDLLQLLVGLLIPRRETFLHRDGRCLIITTISPSTPSASQPLLHSSTLPYILNARRNQGGNRRTGAKLATVLHSNVVWGLFVFLFFLSLARFDEQALPLNPLDDKGNCEDVWAPEMTMCVLNNTG